ncbi:MAG TPA: DUF5309 family protein [Gemmatimonadaceae bacterium]|nr:DUF5309 family protein [Gemmatimonadaceae bacterium]
MTVRAGQNTYTANTTGGTRAADSVDTDIAPFMDALEERATHFLNSLSKKGTAGQRKHEWGLRGVNPRGSVNNAVTTTTQATITVPVGHGVRFQQGHVLQITRASDNAVEVVWVNDDPQPNVLSVKRAQGGTTGLAFAVDDKIAIIGIAMPQLSDFPLAPVTRGRRFFNYCQEFSKHITMSTQNRNTSDYENPSGDWLVEDMMTLGKDIRLDLDRSLLHGRRQAGDPNQADISPAMLGGLIQFAELSGNVYNLGGAATNLAVESIDTAMIDLEEAVGGRNAGKLLLMSLRTKQIFNRLLNPIRYTSGVGVKANSADLTWDSVTLETGTYKFNHMLGIPDGQIWIYDNKNLCYMPYTGLDWKEKEVPTKGNYVWKGISGTFTFEAVGLPGFAVIKGFNTTLSDYPTFGASAA